MSREIIKCRTCGKTVTPKSGVLRRCGVAEHVDDVRGAQRQARREISRAVNRMLPDPVRWFDDDGEEVIEGLPNT